MDKGNRVVKSWMGWVGAGNRGYKEGNAINNIYFKKENVTSKKKTVQLLLGVGFVLPSP